MEAMDEMHELSARAILYELGGASPEIFFRLDEPGAMLGARDDALVVPTEHAVSVSRDQVVRFAGSSRP